MIGPGRDRLPPIIMAAREADATLTAENVHGRRSSSEIARGGRNRAAKKGGLCLAWGFVPSPLAGKILTDGLSIVLSEIKQSRPVIVYCCYAGTHTSVLAATLHLECERKSEKLASVRDLENLRFFDKRTPQDIGLPVKVGVDRHGTAIYAMGTGWLSKDVEWAFCDLIEVNQPDALFCMCSVRGFLDFRSRVGGFLSRRLSVVEPGRRIIASSLYRRISLIRNAVGFCLDLSFRWNDNERQSKGEVIWVDGYSIRRGDSPSR